MTPKAASVRPAASIALAVACWAGGGTAAAVALTTLPPTLNCDFKAVQNGQFEGLHYTGGGSETTISLTLVASAADTKAGRAVMIGADRAAVVSMIVQPRQTVFVDGGTRDDASIISLFTGARQDAVFPAAYSRQMMFGAIPVVSQYTGTCLAQ